LVHYGPPQAGDGRGARRAVAAATHEYQDGAGLPALVARLASKLRDETASTSAAAAASW